MNDNDQRILTMVEVNLDEDGYCRLRTTELIKACGMAKRTFYDRVKSLVGAGRLFKDAQGRYFLEPRKDADHGGAEEVLSDEFPSVGMRPKTFSRNRNRSEPNNPPRPEPKLDRTKQVIPSVPPVAPASTAIGPFILIG